MTNSWELNGVTYGVTSADVPEGSTNFMVGPQYFTTWPDMMRDLGADLALVLARKQAVEAAVAAMFTSALRVTFSTGTTDADPGSGTFRLNNATQNVATQAFQDILDSAGADQSAVIDSWGTGTSTIKGHLLIVQADDPTKFLRFTVSAVTTASGYRKLSVANTGYSAASPFANGASLVVGFLPKGDKGDTGDAGTPASESVAGVAEIATQAETNAGTDDLRIVTPAKLTGRQASQAEAEGGADGSKLMTPQRTKQQVDARLASQADAEAGSDASKLMTPQRTKQAITAQAMLLGYHAVGFLPGNLKPRTSNGCTASTYDDTTAGADYKEDVAEFDTTTGQVGYAHIPMPDGSNGGDIKVKVSARLPGASAGQTGIFLVKARYVRHDDNPASVSWGTAGSVTLTATSTAADNLVSAISSAITPGGTYTDGCSLHLRFERDVANDNGAGKLQFREALVYVQYTAGVDAT